MCRRKGVCMGKCTALMKKAYQSNPRFRQYVDRYREHHNDDLTAITADEALQHACVKEVYLYYQEENKNETLHIRQESIYNV